MSESSSDLAGAVAELLDTRAGDLTAEQLMQLIEASPQGGIRISFSGKQKALQIAAAVRPRVIRPVKKYGYAQPDQTPKNLLVEGDNLQAMVTLYRYRGEVDFILTDPPYNTGRDFRYSDQWETNPNTDDLGHLVDADDGARHTKWLRFMWPRLQLMKSMLKPGGVLAICIDHRELFRLGQTLDELFGEQNRIAIINWQKSYTTRADNKHVSTSTEYILVYAKNDRLAKTQPLPRTAETDARYKNPDGDPKVWKSGHSGGPNPDTHPTMVYAMQHPFTGEIMYPAKRNCWRYGQAQMKAWLEEWGSPYVMKDIGDGKAKALLLKGSAAEARKRAEKRLAQGSWPRLFFGKDGQGKPQIKFYLEDIKQGIVPQTYWADDDFGDPEVLGAVSWDHEQSGHSQLGIEELTAIVGEGHGFDTVKPLKLFKKLIQIWCPPNGLVLDPFAGSGTSGHAVLSGNVESGAARQFILIEQGSPEGGDPYARTLTSDRLRRVCSGDWASGKREALGDGFLYERLSGTIDGDAILGMERADMRDTVIFAHYSEGKRKTGLTPVDPDAGYKYLVATNDDGEGFYLVWDGPDKNTDLTKEVYAAIVDEARKADIKLGRYHVYGRRWVYQRKTTAFYQIPDYILASFGLNIRSEPFADEAELD